MKVLYKKRIRNDIALLFSMLVKWILLSGICSVVIAVTVDEAKYKIYDLKSSGVADHENLQKVLETFSEVIKNVKEDTQNVLDEASSYGTQLCPDGIPKGEEAIVTGSKCIAEALENGISKQFKTQMNCFQVMTDYIIRFTKLTFDVAECGFNITCMSDITTAAFQDRDKNTEIVTQTLNHFWEFKKTFEIDISGCLADLVDGLQNARKLCGVEEPIDTSDWPMQDDEKYELKRFTRSTDSYKNESANSWESSYNSSGPGYDVIDTASYSNNGTYNTDEYSGYDGSSPWYYGNNIYDFGNNGFDFNATEYEIENSTWYGFDWYHNSYGYNTTEYDSVNSSWYGFDWYDNFYSNNSIYNTAEYDNGNSPWNVTDWYDYSNTPEYENNSTTSNWNYSGSNPSPTTSRPGHPYGPYTTESYHPRNTSPNYNEGNTRSYSTESYYTGYPFYPPSSRNNTYRPYYRPYTTESYGGYTGYDKQYDSWTGRPEGHGRRTNYYPGRNYTTENYPYYQDFYPAPPRPRHSSRPWHWPSYNYELEEGNYDFPNSSNDTDYRPPRPYSGHRSKHGPKRRPSDNSEEDLNVTNPWEENGDGGPPRPGHRSRPWHWPSYNNELEEGNYDFPNSSNETDNRPPRRYPGNRSKHGPKRWPSDNSEEDLDVTNPWDENGEGGPPRPGPGQWHRRGPWQRHPYFHGPPRPPYWRPIPSNGWYDSGEKSE